MNKSKLINPGEVSGHMYGHSTFAVWDDESNKLQKLRSRMGGLM
ncbi:MAG: hypothetical protein U0525_04310 [Patescibacteria group bacterium]